MMDVLILRSDGGISRMHLDGDDVTGEEIAREIEAWERGVARSGWTMIGWRQVFANELPARRFRGAWSLPNGIDGPIGVDLSKARQLRKSELERQREKVLERFRERIEEAEDNGQTVRLANLKAKRKALRGLDLAAKLQEVADLVALDTYVPTEMSEP